jgi:hypothetical protein
MPPALIAVEELAEWSPWMPFSEARAAAPRQPGVYLAREGLDGPIVYAGMAGERRGQGIWLGSNKIAVDLAAAAVDVATGQLTGIREKRRSGRIVDRSAEIIAARLEPFITHEFRDLPDRERLAATLAVPNRSPRH